MCKYTDKDKKTIQ
jgi:hypothetical protein